VEALVEALNIRSTGDHRHVGQIRRPHRSYKSLNEALLHAGIHTRSKSDPVRRSEAIEREGRAASPGGRDLVRAASARAAWRARSMPSSYAAGEQVPTLHRLACSSR